MATRRVRRNPSLPSAPPKRRFSGAPVAATQQERSALARVRRIAGSVNERERPFNPERPGSWRGSSRDLVVNPKDSSSYGAGARLRPGYAFEGPDVPNRELMEIPNDDWETVMISEDDCKDTRFVQYLTIDGARCSVFERKSPPYGYLAQMSHMARNSGRQRRNGDVDTRDIPAHLRKAEINEIPDHNGQNIGYSQGYRSKEEDGWYQVEYATGSDYSGGSVNESNYQVLGEMLEEHHPEDAEPVVWARTSGGHGTYGIVVRYGDLEEEAREAIDALEDYPLMDEEHHSNLEMEQQQAAWDDWGIGDLSKAIAKETGVDRDELRDNLTDDDWHQIFDLVMQRGDITWEDQHGAGQYIDMDQVAKQVVRNLENMPSYATPEQDKAYELLGNLVGEPE